MRIGRADRGFALREGAPPAVPRAYDGAARILALAAPLLGLAILLARLVLPA